jgi:hypothetical protein
MIRGARTGNVQRKAGAPPAFSPDDISNMVLWLEADYQVLDSVGVAADNGDNVDEWTNRANATYSGSQSTDGNRPEYKTAVNSDSGYDCVYFDGVDEWMDMQNNAAPFIPSTGDFHIFIVANLIDTSVGYPWSQRTSSGNSGGIEYLFLDQGTRTRSRITYIATASTPNITQTLDNNDGPTDNIEFIEIKRAGGNFVMNIYSADGTLQATDTDSDASKVLQQVGMILGARSTGATYNASTGDHSEIEFCAFLIYQQEVTGTDLTDLKTYLSKWGWP